MVVINGLEFLKAICGTMVTPEDLAAHEAACRGCMCLF